MGGWQICSPKTLGLSAKNIIYFVFYPTYLLFMCFSALWLKASRYLLLPYSFLISVLVSCSFFKKHSSSWDLRILFTKADSTWSGKKSQGRWLVIKAGLHVLQLSLVLSFYLCDIVENLIPWIKRSGLYSRLLGGNCQVSGTLHQKGMSCLPEDLNHTKMIWSQGFEPARASLPTRVEMSLQGRQWCTPMSGVPIKLSIDRLTHRCRKIMCLGCFGISPDPIPCTSLGGF